jgi:hypothetical protein
MSAQLHSHSGSLRLRFSLLKKSPARLDCVCDALRGISGMEHVEASALTGAILIRYDGTAANNHRFWDEVEAVLEYNHLYHEQRAVDRHDDIAAPRNPVRRLVQRSAQVLAAVLR